MIASISVRRFAILQHFEVNEYMYPYNYRNCHSIFWARQSPCAPLTESVDSH